MEEAANRALRIRRDLVTDLPGLVNLAEVRNRVIFGCDSIDNLIVGTVVRVHIPPVIEHIQQLLSEIE